MSDAVSALAIERVLLSARRAGLLAELTVIDAEIAKRVSNEAQTKLAPELSSEDATDSGAAAPSPEAAPSDETPPPPPAARNNELPELAEEKDRSRPDELTVKQYRVWRAIAEAISETGYVPNRAVIAIRAKVGLLAMPDMILQLTAKGYLRRTGSARSAVLHVLKWPEGVAPRETLGRADGRLKGFRPPRPAPEPKEPREPKAARRFTEMPDLDPESVRGLPDDHAAVTEGRTLFPTTVVDAIDAQKLLVPGHNSRKLGSHVTKGPWKGFPIYSLTLEERATCPRSCRVWSECYGNGMPMARRHRHGPELENLLQVELRRLNTLHPKGFVVRLHQLGDFYSVEYVELWRQWLEEFPALHVFGYTAHRFDFDDAGQFAIGNAICDLTDAMWERFAIRFSFPCQAGQNAVTIKRIPKKPKIAEGIVCPAQMKRTDCCGTCGLCWHPNARKETIVFVLHGNAHLGRPPRQDVEAIAAAPPEPAVRIVPAVKPRKARGAYQPRPRPPLPAIIPVDPGVVETPEVPGTLDVLRETVRRRCQNAHCQKVFDSQKVGEILCPACSAPYGRKGFGTSPINGNPGGRE